MDRLLGRDKKTGYGQTVWPQKDGGQKTRGSTPIGAKRDLFSHKKGFHGVARKKPARPRHWPRQPWCRRPLPAPAPAPTPTPTASGRSGRQEPWPTQSAVDHLGRWLRSSGPADSPDDFVGALSALLRLSGPDGAPLPTDLQKGGGLHAFLGRLTDDAVPVLGLAEIMLLGVDREEGLHIL